jgi:hypothetical protein
MWNFFCYMDFTSIKVYIHYGFLDFIFGIKYKGVHTLCIFGFYFWYKV